MHPNSNGLARKGFTLIELMVVMLLISILLAIAMPRFQVNVAQDPVKKTSRWIIHNVRVLRTAAVQKQKQHAIVIDLNRNCMWVVNADMDDEALAAAAEKSFNLPDALRIVDVQFPDKDRLSDGTAEIHFYPAGYSDEVVIHLENASAERYSFIVEPLLPKVKIIDEWKAL